MFSEAGLFLRDNGLIDVIFRNSVGLNIPRKVVQYIDQLNTCLAGFRQGGSPLERYLRNGGMTVNVHEDLLGLLHIEFP